MSPMTLVWTFSNRDSADLYNLLSAGGHRRAFPSQSSSKVPFNDNSNQLAAQLRHRIRHTIHGERGPRLCQSSEPRLLRKPLRKFARITVLTSLQVWGSFCFICIAFVWFMIYETKGLSLEQVDELYGIVSKAWKSRNFRPQLSFQDVEEMGGAKRGMSMSEMADVSQRKRSVDHVEVPEKAW